MTFGPTPKDGSSRAGESVMGLEGWNFQLSPCPISWEGIEAGNWVQSPVTNDLINHAYVWSLQKPSGGQGSKSFQAGEHMKIQAEWYA